MTRWRGSRVAGRRSMLAGALCAVLLAVGAGCGIPDNSEVQVDGSGPAVEAGESSFRRDEPPARMAAGLDEEAFVENYLAAAAGEPERAYDRVRLFIGQESRSRLQPKPGNEIKINVIRLTEPPKIAANVGGFNVELSVQQVGQLGADGVLSPPVATEERYTFSLRTAGQEGSEEAGLYVTAPPNVLLLSTEALQQYYEPRDVYFWNTDQSRLVADQRYLPRTVPQERVVSEVVKWLTGGPSEWLGPGVSRLPARTNLINNAVETDGRWEVALDLPGDDKGKLEKLATQLAWSLPDVDGPLQLTTRNQSRVSIDSLDRYRLANPLYALGDGPQPFTVYDGAVHPLSFPGQPSGPVPVATTANRGIVSATVRRVDDRLLAALVTTVPGGRRQLRVGYGADPVPVTMGHTSRQTFAAISRPVWLRSLDPGQPYGLVAADGQLYRFDDGAVLLQVPVNVTGAVTAVAVSLDGRRVALIVGGKLYVAVVNLDGGVVSLPAREVPTSLTDLSAVDWAAENDLVVAGTDDRSGVYEVSVDGTVQTPLVGDVNARVTHLAAYPTNPVLPRPSALIMYEANGVAYRYPSVEKIRGDQVLDVTPPPAGVRPGTPTAPFFLY